MEQNDDQFNYDDLVTRFTVVDTTLKELERDSEPVKVNIQNIVITNGTITYHDKIIKHEFVLQKLNWDAPIVRYKAKREDLDKASLFTVFYLFNNY